MIILNLTQHAATAEQVNAGVVDLPPDLRAELCALLTFIARPSVAEITARAKSVAALAAAQNLRGTQYVEEIHESDSLHESGAPIWVMIGGAPFFMSALERALDDESMRPLYAFSERVSVEKTDDAGRVVKTNVFKHAGFVEVFE
jgi:hypothetical protein